MPRESSRIWRTLRTLQGRSFYLRRRDRLLSYLQPKSLGDSQHKEIEPLQVTNDAGGLPAQRASQFKALSYAWHAPERDCNAWVADALGQNVLGRLHITRSLDVE